MWWIFIIAIIVLIVYNMLKDRKEDLVQGVENYGGMLSKYSLLVDYFTQHPANKIRKQTSSSIVISSSAMTICIDYVAGDTEILLKGELPILGRFSKHWVFPNGYPQDKMVEEIDNFLEWKMEGFNKIITSSKSDHIDLVEDNPASSVEYSDIHQKEKPEYNEIFSIEEFCKMQGIKQIDIQINPKKVNPKTGEKNLFLVFGKETGIVAEKVQRAYYEKGEMPDRPMIGLTITEDGSQIYTLFNQSGSESAYSLGLED